MAKACFPPPILSLSLTKISHTLEQGRQRQNSYGSNIEFLVTIQKRFLFTQAPLRCQDNLTPGQFDTADNLTPPMLADNLTPGQFDTGQFDTADNLTPDNLTPGQFDTGQFDTRTIWHRGQFDTMCKNGQFDTAYNLTPWKFLNNFFVSQPSAQRAHRHPLTVIYPPNVGRIYPIQIYIFNWHMFSPTQRPKGAQTPSNCHISPNCWQNISNTSIYIQLTPPPNAHASV